MDNYTLAYQILDIVSDNIGNNWNEGVGSTDSVLRYSIADKIAYLLDQSEAGADVTNEAVKFNDKESWGTDG